jgi:hypothetical protein
MNPLEQSFDFMKRSLGRYAIRGGPFVTESFESFPQQIVLSYAKRLSLALCSEIPYHFAQRGEQSAL